MLVRLYALPDGSAYAQRASVAGISVRRAEPWDRSALRAFIIEHFTGGWADEAEVAFAAQPINAYVAVQQGKICGFAVYEAVRRGFFGPTGVREDLRGNGAGAALLFACLRSMREAGYGYAIIGGVGPAEFYARTCGATIIEGSDPGVYAALYAERAARRSSTPEDASHSA